jgi:Papain family cysteine protease
MKKNLVLLLALALMPFFGFGQGMLFDSETFNGIPKVPVSDGSKSTKLLPFAYDLSQYTPTIFNQGKNDMTCVAISTAYYAIGTQRAAQLQETSPTAIANNYCLSPLFSFVRIQKECTNGIDLKAVAVDLESWGGIPFSVLDASECKDTRISSTLKGRHNYIKIKQIQWVFNKEKFPNESFVYDVKKLISEKHPVVVGIPLYSNFSEINQANHFYIPNKKPITTIQGNKSFNVCHAVVAVGYDSNRGAIKFVNSHGPSWGDNGFFWMTESDFEQYAKGGFVIQLYPEQPSSPQGQIPTNSGARIGGDFEFKSISTSPNGLTFKTESPRYVRNGLYELPKKDWKKGQMFQLFAKNTSQGESMCVFSINERQEINVHWPTSYVVSPQGSKTLNSQDIYGGWEVSDLIGNNSLVVIPGTETALVIDEKGTDHLCILFGKNSIQSELPDILSKLQKTDTTMAFPLRLRKALGSRAVTSSINYSTDKMHFEATLQQGDIVPIILEVISK